MTPWDVITADSLPAGAAIVALSAAPGGPVDWADVAGAVSPGPVGALTWTGPAAVTPGLLLAARPARVRFDPPLSGAVLQVQALALVDQRAGPQLLALWPLRPPAPLSAASGALVVDMLLVVQGQQ